MLQGLRSAQLATGFALDSYLESWQHGTQWRSAALRLDTVSDVEYHVGVTNLEYRVPVAGLQESATFPHSSNHQSQPGIDPGTFTS